ncbi:hypothetical protein [Acetivibrio ethanolgignens]|uniref:hypothetical protein n=1 Tax=Acetivibrio ethanolgignens TaxID=290052 RepID=UPI0011CCC3E9|nr:hypothetical protein [Acetivibrio ethanolgignens]
MSVTLCFEALTFDICVLNALMQLTSFDDIIDLSLPPTPFAFSQFRLYVSQSLLNNAKVCLVLSTELFIVLNIVLL